MFGRSMSLIAVATAAAAAVMLPAGAAATTPTPTAPATVTTTPSVPTPPATSRPAEPATPDLVAIGATVRAGDAKYVKLKVGVKNAGPVSLVLPPDTATEHPVVAYIHLPGNTFGSEVPYRCAGWGAGPDGWDWLDPGRPSNAYACLGGTIQPGATDWIELTVLMRRDRPATPGYVRVGAPNANQGNDRAAITVITAAAPVTTTTTGDSTGIPTTGAPIVALISGGIALLVLGSVAFLAARFR